MRTGAVARGGALLGAAAAAGAVLAGCSDTPPEPSASELSAITLPTSELPPNVHSDSGPCALLTGAEITQETGAQVDRTSEVAGGCVWQGDDGGTRPIVNLRVLDDLDGDIMRVYGDTKRDAAEAGPVREIDGLGERAFTTASAAPTVWWVQGGHVYGLSVLSSAAASGDAGATAALDLARLASSRVEG